MKYQIETEYKGKKIVIEGDPNIPALFVDGKAVISHEFLSNKQLVCKLYSLLLEEIRKTPKSYFKSLDFAKLVPAIEHIVGCDNFLRSLRARNLDGGAHYSSTTYEKACEEISKTVREAINFDWSTCDKFSRPQQWTLKVISNGYIGHDFDTYNFQQIYKPVKDDVSEVESVLKEFEKFPFGKYISKNAVEEILTAVRKYHAQAMSEIEVFRKMRAVAGEDVVNWGAHKYESQKKRAGISGGTYTAKNWLIEDVAKALINKGVKPAEKKQTAAQKLKAQFEAATKQPDNSERAPEFTSEDLVKLFKNASESTAASYVNLMDAETAVSLLDLQTKNVFEKLYYTNGTRLSPRDGLRAIVNCVAAEDNAEAFKKLITFLRVNSLFEIGTWNLFKKHVGRYTVNDFMGFCDHAGNRFDEDHIGIDRKFFDQVVSQLPVEYRYTTHSLVTDAYLSYVADDAQKISLLRSIGLPAGDRHYRINWDLSAKHFQGLPYEEIRAFVYNPANGHISSEWDNFAQLILDNKDSELARAILLNNTQGETPYEFFGMFDFNSKVEILSHTSRNYLEIKEVLTKEELNDFGRIALTRSKLCKYATELPLSTLNENIKVADVTSRIMNETLYVPLNETMIKAMNKDAAKRVLERASIQFVTSYGSVDQNQERLVDLKADLYAKLTRKEVEQMAGHNLAESDDYLSLVKHMTQAEIIDSANRSVSFIRKHLDSIPVNYLLQFTDKAKFKDLVGDRRKRNNDSFGNRLEAILKGVTVAA